MAKAARKKNAGKIDNVKIRMYCLGTGDCFVLKFCSGTSERFTMMIDCGTCKGKPHEVEPYIKDLAGYVNNHIDLLVITHEHNDHVNGFAKCEDIFSDANFKIDEAWFAWTEKPGDPGGKAEELQKKRKKMRMALSNAIGEYKRRADSFKKVKSDDYYKAHIERSHVSFINGLNTLSDINLAAASGGDKPLPGMVKIKAILKDKKTNVQYLAPGQTVTLDKLPGFKFYVLGPPYERDFIFKDGKEGTDVFKKKLNFYESALAANSFLNLDKKDILDKDIPFAEHYVVEETRPSVISSLTTSREAVRVVSSTVKSRYYDLRNKWRTIDDDWLNSTGSLALRLNSHINNTSLVLAIEADDSKKVILLPGDAEYGSWESWHAIDVWKKKGKGGIHLVEDLLNRTVFYKVGHHLSFNGTAVKLGINMMPTSGMVAMATLDRKRISKVWKSTMPNKYLLEELNRRCQGKFFLMNEFEVKNKPSAILDPASLSKTVYEQKNFDGKKEPIFIQYTCKV